MSNESERENLEQQLGKHLLDVVQEPSVRLLGKANGAVGGLNLVAIVGLLAYQVIVIPTKDEINSLKDDVADVQKTSVTTDDLDRVSALAQKDIEGIRLDVRELKTELRENSRKEVPSWLNDRLRTLESDVRSLQGLKAREEK